VQRENKRDRDRSCAFHTGGSQYGGIIYDPVGTKDMTAKSLYMSLCVLKLATQGGSEKMREIEIDLELAIQEGTSMGGLYMTLWVLKI